MLAFACARVHACACARACVCARASMQAAGSKGGRVAKVVGVCVCNHQLVCMVHGPCVCVGGCTWPCLPSHNQPAPGGAPTRGRGVLQPGNELEHFAEFIGAPDSGEGGRTPISGTCLSVETLRTRHSELCYGFRLYCTAGEREHLLLGWTVRLGLLATAGGGQGACAWGCPTLRRPVHQAIKVHLGIAMGAARSCFRPLPPQPARPKAGRPEGWLCRMSVAHHPGPHACSLDPWQRQLYATGAAKAQQQLW